MALRRAHRLVGERLLHARLGGEEPAFRDLRGDRLAAVVVVERGGDVLGLRRGRARAHAPPEVELPVHEHADALQPARVAAHLAAAAREQVHLRVEQRARDLLVCRGLLDARRRDAEIGVVGERFPRQLVELRIAEGREPAVGDGARGTPLRGPLLRDLPVRPPPPSPARRARGGDFSAQAASAAATATARTERSARIGSVQLQDRGSSGTNRRGGSPCG